MLPGGVDPHCHLMPGVHPATAAAACGGTTTVLSFTGPAAGERDLDALLRNRGELERGGAVTDIGLHAAIYDPEHIGHDDLAAVKRAGAAAIKIFLAYPELGIMCSTRRLYELMSAARELGLLVQVHCENAPLIDVLVDEAVAAGARGARVFADTRPHEVEEEAVARTLEVASLAGAACYLVHLSSAGSVEQVRLARRRGQRGVIAEVCTHHLLLDDTRYAGADAERYLVCPPLRDRSHVEALWEGLADGTIDTVGSDHCQVKSATSGPLAEDGQLLHLRAGGRRAPAAAAAVRGGGAGPAHRAGGAARGGEPGAGLRALPGQGRARAGIRRRHRDLRSRWRRPSCRTTGSATAPATASTRAWPSAAGSGRCCCAAS